MSDQATCSQCGTALPVGALSGLCPACLLEQGAARPSSPKGDTRSPDPLPLDEVARLFPQLEILGLIGKGGMGAIYKARQRTLDRLVALKLLPTSGAGSSADFAERFNREARALARLSHPNIVAVYEFGEIQGLRYFLMEFVDGVNLRQLQSTGRLGPREALQIVPQICDALQYAHDQGVVHRDIKPENVLIDRKGRVKIADFGLAKILGREPVDLRLTMAGQVMGTPHYMAPEQVERPLDVDHRADIYALGVIFYEMLTGELPLGKFAPPSRKVQVDVRLDDVVLHALEKEPELRYQHASQVKNDVATIVDSPATTARPATRRPYGLRPLRRALVAGFGTLLFILLVSALVTLVLPETYMSAARVELRGPAGEASRFDSYLVQTEVERIKSQAVLEGALERVHLSQVWAQRYGAGQRLSMSQMVALLRKNTDVRQAPNTALIEIRCFSEDRNEAAQLANAIAQSYAAMMTPMAIQIVDPAEPSPRPTRPNVPLNLALGWLAGMIVGAVVGGIVFLITRWSVRNSPETRDADQSSYVANIAIGLGVLVAAAVSYPAFTAVARSMKEPQANASRQVGVALSDVHPPHTQAQPDSTDSSTLSPGAEASIAQPPELRFLGRQREVTANDEPTNAWHADGTLVVDRKELLLLRQLGVARLDVDALPEGRDAPIYCLWFSHPAFDSRSECQVRLEDTDGHPIPAFRGSVSSSLRQANQTSDHQGWFIADLAIPPDKADVQRANVLLDYTLGPWTYRQVVNVQSNLQEQISIDGGQITAPGQSLEGRAFIGLVRDISRHPELQYDFEAETKRGPWRQAMSVSASGVGNLRTQHYEFDVPIESVRTFHLRTRPIRTAIFNNVTLAPASSHGH